MCSPVHAVHVLITVFLPSVTAATSPPITAILRVLSAAPVQRGLGGAGECGLLAGPPSNPRVAGSVANPAPPALHLPTTLPTSGDETQPRES